MFGIVAAIVLCAPSQASIANRLAAEFQEKDVIRQIAKLTNGNIAIGSFFIAPAKIGSGHAQLAKEAIRMAIEKTEGLTENEDAKFELRGNVFLQTEGDEPEKVKKAFAKMKFEVFQLNNGDRVGDAVKFSTSTPGIVATLLGRNITIDPNKNTQEREKKVFEIANEVVSAPKTPDEPPLTQPTITQGDYSVQLLVMGKGDAGFHPIGMLVNESGSDVQARLALDDIFRIKVTNHDNQRARTGEQTDALVEVIIDGVNVFRFAKDPAFRNRRFVVRSRGEATIYGWFKSKTESAAFQVANYPESVRGELGLPPDDVKARTITLVIRQAHQIGRGGGFNVGVKQGGAIGIGAAVVRMKAGPEAAIMSIRYGEDIRFGDKN